MNSSFSKKGLMVALGASVFALSSFTALHAGDVWHVPGDKISGKSWDEAAKPQTGSGDQVVASVASVASVSGTSGCASLVNGSFETGDYTGWTLFEDSGSPEYGTWGIASNGQTINPGDFVFDFFDGINVGQHSVGLPHTYRATDGNFLALQLQNGPERHRISQNVTLGTCDTITLSWDMEYANHHEMGFDSDLQFLAVHIRDVATDTILKTLFKTTEGVDPHTIPMTTFTANISEFAGQTVRIDVEIQEQIFHFDAAFDNFVIGCECDKRCDHAVYSVEGNRSKLIIPFIDIPLLDPNTHQLSDEFGVFQGELNLKKGVFVDFGIVPNRLKFVSFTQVIDGCHAVYSYQDKTLHIPFVDVGSEVYEATLKHLQEVPLDLGVFRLKNYEFLYTLD